MKTKIQPRTGTSIHNAGVPEVELTVWAANDVLGDDYVTLRLDFGGGAQVIAFIHPEAGQDGLELATTIADALKSPQVSFQRY